MSKRQTVREVTRKGFRIRKTVTITKKRIRRK